MNTVSAIAISGVNAATLRLRAAASNIANIRSTGALPGVAGPEAYTPLEVEQSPAVNGGVEARLASSPREALNAYDPTARHADAAGYVAAPDVDVIEQMLQLATARYSFAANLKVLQTSGHMLDEALNILA
jgi:flagellar basal-body rod protein FlgC